MDQSKPYLSLVIPVYNEEPILAESVENLISVLASRLPDIVYELVLCENGSTDTTFRIASDLAKRWTQIRVERLPIASYGRAIKHGIEVSQGRLIVILNADFWDIDFIGESVSKFADFDVLVGSKNIAGAVDRRPILRRLITTSFNLLLRLLFGFKGTDTHGVKALRSSCIKTLAQECRTDAEVFDTELLLRAQRARLRLIEVPISVEERRPSRYGLMIRIPRTIRDLIALIKALHLV